MVAKMVASAEWKEIAAPARLGRPLPAFRDFAAFLKSEQTRVKATLEDIGLVK